MKFYPANAASVLGLSSAARVAAPLALLILCVCPVPLRAQAVGATTLVSVNLEGTASSRGGGALSNLRPRAAVTPDGRFVVFSGGVTPDIAPGISDPNNVGGIFVRDTVRGTTTVVNVTPAGNTIGDGPSFDPSISDDGRYVAFMSFADDLTANDTNDHINNGSPRIADIFVRDLQTATTTLVSVNLNGTSSSNFGILFVGADQARISNDGRFVLFTSDALDLAANDSNDSIDLFVRDLRAGTTTVVSVNRAGVASGNRTRLTSGGFFNFDPEISADGRYIAFVSYAPNMTADDTVCFDGPCDGLNSLPDIFVRDIVAGTTTLVDVNRAGTGGGEVGATDPSLSADGRRIAFRSASRDLVANDTTPQFDIYVRDLDARTTALVSVNRFGTNGGSTPSGGINSFDPLISADGRSVAFTSSATDLVANKTDFLTQDVFVRDLQAGTTTLVSVNLAGTDSPSSREGPPFLFKNSLLSDISADGRYVVFESSISDLIANDTNGAFDVFVRDVAAGTTTLASINHAGTASGNAVSGLADLTSDGRFVVFSSLASDLVANDTNGMVDVFRRALPQPGSVQFTATNFNVSESDGRALITITRVGDASLPATITLRTVDGAADVPCDPTLRQPDGMPYPQGQAYARCDFATTIETVSWVGGETQPKTVSIPLIDDAHAEGNETVQLRLTDQHGATLGDPSSATLTILDNDAGGQANPLADNAFFVRMHYLDFLAREPEAGEPWTHILDTCPIGDATCDRITVSAAFFGSPEFRLNGFYVFTFYRVAFNRLPAYDEIVADMRQVTGATAEEVYRNRAQFAMSFAGRQEFGWIYRLLTEQQFVDALLGRYSLQQITTPDPLSPEAGAKVVLTRADLVNRLRGGDGRLSRAQVLRAVVQSDEVSLAEYHRAFVAMQYYSYLRRTPEPTGYQGWLDYLNAHPADFREMVRGFVDSTEYRRRFGQP